MPPARILLVRHAEKPAKESDVHGVDRSGTEDSRDLDIRGWQRAGALARFLAPIDGRFVHPALAQPSVIYAAGTGDGSPSKRSKHTVKPLAEVIGLEIMDRFLKGEETALAAAVAAEEGVVLIAWEHKAIGDIVRLVTGGEAAAPEWPEDRFDVVLVLSRDYGRWRLQQVPQRLLAGDREAPL